MRLGLAQALGEQLENRPGVARAIAVARPQIGNQQQLVAEDVERQEAPVAVVTVIEAPFLVPMHPVIGRVKIQDQLRRRCGKRGDEFFQQHLVKSQRRLTIHPLLEPAQRRAGGQGVVTLYCGLAGHAVA